MLVGLTGPAGSGKSTCARILCQRAGFVEIALADPVKDMLAVICSPRCLHDDKAARIEWIGRSGRELMQTLGTEWGRNMVNVDLWVKIAEVRLDAIGVDSNVVVSDVRFENEADMIRRRGGAIIRLGRPGYEMEANHASEAGIERRPSDFELNDNSGNDDIIAGLLDQILMVHRGRVAS